MGVCYAPPRALFQITIIGLFIEPVTERDMTKISNLCVFCGSKKGENPAFEADARQLGAEMVRRDVGLVYGGGGIGLMGAITDEVLKAGGRVTGIIPDFLMQYEVGNPDITELVVVDSMHDRKRTMFERSDAFVVLPGGLGTLDETFEIITWKQLRQHSKPVVVLDSGGYWKPFEALVDSIIEGGFAHPAVKELFTVVGRVEDIFDALASAPEPQDVVLTSHL